MANKVTTIIQEDPIDESQGDQVEMIFRTIRMQDGTRRRELLIEYQTSGTIYRKKWVLGEGSLPGVITGPKLREFKKACLDEAKAEWGF